MRAAPILLFSSVALLACAMETLDAGGSRESVPVVDAGTSTPLADDALVVTRTEAESVCQLMSDGYEAIEANCLGMHAPMPAPHIRQCVEMLSAPGVSRAGFEAVRQCVARNATGVCATTSWNCVEGITGTRRGGEGCVTDIQCASGWCQGSAPFYPKTPFQPSCGRCAEPLAAGSTCRPLDHCAHGSCVRDCSAQDSDCTGTCVEHETKVEADDAATSAWTPTRVGDPCNSAADCIGWYQCDPATHSCVALRVLEPGDECPQEGARCPDEQPGCLALGNGTSRCLIWRKEGESCGGTYGDPAVRCEYGLRCENERCVFAWPVCP